MNPEFERLVNVMLTDGYIDDAEKALLLKRATHLSIDEAEAEIFLENKQLAKRQELAAKKNATNTCVECGSDLVNGSCNQCGTVTNGGNGTATASVVFDYKENEEYISLLSGLTDDVERAKLDKDGFYTLRIPKIIFTGGAYILYKLILRREPLFNGNPPITNTIKFKALLYSEMALLTSNNPKATQLKLNSENSTWKFRLKKVIWYQFLQPFYLALIFIGLPVVATLIIRFANDYQDRKEESELAMQKQKEKEAKTDANSPENSERIADSLFNAGNYTDAYALGKLLPYDQSHDFLTDKAFKLLEKKNFKFANQYLDGANNTLLYEKRFKLAEYIEKHRKQ